MGHHKRHRPKHQRAGCLMCKPHKDERATKAARPSDKRRMQDELPPIVVHGTRPAWFTARGQLRRNSVK